MPFGGWSGLARKPNALAKGLLTVCWPAFITIEAVTGKPVPERILKKFHTAGMATLIVLPIPVVVFGIHRFIAIL